MMMKHKQNIGFSIVELMIALLISSILFTGIIQIFISNKQAFNSDQALSQLQETGRSALDYLTWDIRMAGYQGCLDPDPEPDPVSGAVIVANIKANGMPTTSFSPISAFKMNESGQLDDPSPPAFLTFLNGIAKAETDVFVVQYASDQISKITTPMPNVLSDIVMVDNNAGLVTNDFAIISDCDMGDIFKITGITGSTLKHSSTGNNSASLTKRYGGSIAIGSMEARISKFIVNIFYIKDTGRNNAQGNNIFALYQRDIKGDDIELFAGVEDMRVLYIECINCRDPNVGNDTMRIVEGKRVVNMRNVIAMRLALLVNTIDEVSAVLDDKVYKLLDETVEAGGDADQHPQDNMYRRVFSTSILLRNRRVN